MNSEIRWGMIGCGDVTEKKSAPSFNKIDGSSLAGVYSRSPDRARSYAKRHGVPRVFDSADEMVDDPGIDAVYVATPPSSHAGYSIRAMHAGKPVYVEKPMAATWEDCRKMNAVSDETGVPLFVAYYRRSMEYFLKVQELLEGGAIGKPVLCRSVLLSPPRPADFQREDLPWRVIPSISGGGYFHDMGCHELDLFLYLFGEMKEAGGFALNTGDLYEPEDTVIASIEFNSGLLYTGSWCFTAPANAASDMIEITGETGSLRFSCFDFTPIEMTGPEGKTTYPVEPPEHVQLPMIRSVVDELLGRGSSPSHGDSAARVNWLMEKILGPT
jgi:predicted dehydrogenase